MAAKKRKPRKVADLTTRILIDIRDEIRNTNARLDQTNARLEENTARLDARLDRLTARVDLGFAEVHARLDKTNARLETLRDLSGEAYRELDARLRVVEQRQGIG
jgi:hypothetical protein